MHITGILNVYYCCKQSLKIKSQNKVHLQGQGKIICILKK